MAALAPPDAGVKAMLAPEMGLPSASFRRATSGAPKAVLIVALCPVPLATVSDAAAPAVFVSVKVVLTPPTVAVTLYVPACRFAVAVTLASPDEVVVAGEPARTALAPEPGAEKVTLVPGTTLPSASFTTTTSAPPNAVPTVALCPLPLLTAIDAGAPAVFVSVALACSAPVAATTPYVPATVPAVAVTLARPEAFVVTGEPVITAVAPLPGGAKVTWAPATGLFSASLTSATIGDPNGVPTVALWPLPLLIVIDAAAPTVFVSENVVETPPTVAVTEYEPTVPPAVAVTLARPEELVVAGVPVRFAVAPEPGAEKVTLAPGTTFPFASFTTTTSGPPKAVPTVALWPLPLLTAMLAGAPALLVRVKVAERPDTDAVTEYVPDTVSALAVTLASPDELVVAGDPVRTALAPLPGALKVIAVPEMGFPEASLRRATSGAPKAVPTVALCPLPLLTVSDAGAPATLVIENVVDSPPTEAVTV